MDIAKQRDMITSTEARELTDRIKVAVDATWQLIKQAYVTRAWESLGYVSWDDYCIREFGTSRLRLPREERQEVVSSMREIGMSVRAIASATGDSKDTVHRALTAVSNETPADYEQIIAGLSDDEFETVISDARADGDMSTSNVYCLADNRLKKRPEHRVTGVDGKTYTATTKRQPKSASTWDQRHPPIDRRGRRGQPVYTELYADVVRQLGFMIDAAQLILEKPARFEEHREYLFEEHYTKLESYLDFITCMLDDLRGSEAS